MKRLVFILVLFALASLAVPAFAASYSVSVQTDKSSYVGEAQIAISGTVSPAPGPNTAVIVVVSNPNRATVDIQDDPVNSATGSYNQITVAGGSISCGGSPCWIAGTYLVNATWSGDGATVITTTTFTYSPLAPETTTVSCAPASFVADATSRCTASISGGAGTSTDGETVTFSQTGGLGTVSFPSPATCALSGNSCSITVTGGNPGGATVQASYPGDASNAASSGNATLTALVGHTNVTTSNSSSTSSPSASSSSSTAITTTCVDCSVTFTPVPPTSSGGGLGSAAYLVLIVVALIAVLLGVAMWRRKAAGDYRDEPK